jgi:hypothetical protein
LAALLRAQLEHGIPTIVRQRQHLSKEWRILDLSGATRPSPMIASRARALKHSQAQLAVIAPLAAASALP